MSIDESCISHSVHNALWRVKSKRTVLSVHSAQMREDDRPDYAIRLEQARVKRGFQTPMDAVQRFGWTYDTYIQHENGTRGITRAASKYAAAYRVSEGWLLTGEGEESVHYVPIVGLAGAGPDGSVLFAEGDGNFGEIIAPPGASANAEALEVRGTSMHGMANDGWMIFYDEKTAPNAEHMGEPCVCWLEDGRVLVKTPYSSREPGLFDLESTNAPLMRDIPVRAMALVTDIKTRKAVQKYLRRNPDVHFVDIPTR